MISARSLLILTICISLVASISAQEARTAESQSKGCPVTLPNTIQPPAKDFGGTIDCAPNIECSHFNAGSHGNGKLWTILPLDGRTVRGSLRIRGRRLDAPASPLKSEIPSGYGETGFQASSILFPTAGCWEVTSEVGGSTLTFVVEIIAPQL
jgi:hypothetical protein